MKFADNYAEVGVGFNPPGIRPGKPNCGLYQRRPDTHYAVGALYLVIISLIRNG